MNSGSAIQNFAQTILAHTAFPSGGIFIVCLSLVFLDLHGSQRRCRLLPVHHAKAGASIIKQTIYQKLANSNGKTFNIIPHVCYFSYHASIAASETWSLTTLLSTKMRGEGTQSQEHQHTCLSNLQQKQQDIIIVSL